MTFHPFVPVDVSVCFGHGNAAQRGWVLLLRSRDMDCGVTIYVTHGTGGPSTENPFKVMIRESKHLVTGAVSWSQKFGSIDTDQVEIIRAAAMAVSAQSRQTYIVAVMAELEVKELVPPGAALHLFRNVCIDYNTFQYCAANPVSLLPSWEQLGLRKYKMGTLSIAPELKPNVQPYLAKELDT